MHPAPSAALRILFRLSATRYSPRKLYSPRMSTLPVTSLTPMMRQYLEVKAQHPDAILFFRLGDFYEMFFDDAVGGAGSSSCTLTTRDKGKESAVPMCGVPHHAASGYLAQAARRRPSRWRSASRSRTRRRRQGARQARGDARRHARHGPRRRAPRGAKAAHFLAGLVWRAGGGGRWRVPRRSPPASSAPPLADAEDALDELARLGRARCCSRRAGRGGASAGARRARPSASAAAARRWPATACSSRSAPASCCCASSAPAPCDGFGLGARPPAVRRRRRRSPTPRRRSARPRRMSAAWPYARPATTWSSTRPPAPTSSCSQPLRRGAGGEGSLLGVLDRTAHRDGRRARCAAGSPAAASTWRRSPPPRRGRAAGGRQRCCASELRERARARSPISSAWSARAALGAAPRGEAAALRDSLAEAPGHPGARSAALAGDLGSRCASLAGTDPPRRARRRAGADAGGGAGRRTSSEGGAASPPASTPSSTATDRSPATASGTSSRSRRASASAPASARSRSATTASSATTSRSRAPTWHRVPGRLRAQADAGQRRALRHPRARGATRRRSSPPTSGGSSSSRGSSRELRERSPPRPPACSRSPTRVGAARRPAPPRRGGRPAAATCGPKVDDWPARRSRSRDGRHPVVEQRRRRRLRAQRRRARSRRGADRRSSPARTWPASRPTCARSR